MLVICYYQSLRYEFNIEEEKSFLISSNGKSPIPVLDLENDITLKNIQGQLVYIIDQKEKELTNGVEISGIVFYLANNHLQKVVQQLPLSLGDEISFQGTIVKLFPDEIQIWGGLIMKHH